MSKVVAGVVISLLAVAAIAQTPGFVNYADLLAIVRKAYVCGQIEGTRKAFLPDRVSDIPKLKALWSEGGCEAVATLTGLTGMEDK